MQPFNRTTGMVTTRSVALLDQYRSSLTLYTDVSNSSRGRSTCKVVHEAQQVTTQKSADVGSPKGIFCVGFYSIHKTPQSGLLLS